MEPNAPTKRIRPKSKVTLVKAPSSEPSPSGASPDLLQTVGALQQRIIELENEGKLSQADRDELKALRAEVAELKESKGATHGPETQESRTRLNLGWFSL